MDYSQPGSVDNTVTSSITPKPIPSGKPKKDDAFQRTTGLALGLVGAGAGLLVPGADVTGASEAGGAEAGYAAGEATAAGIEDIAPSVGRALKGAGSRVAHFFEDSPKSNTVKPATAPRPYTAPRTVPEPAPGYPNPTRSTTIGDRPPINADVPKAAQQPKAPGVQGVGAAPEVGGVKSATSAEEPAPSAATGETPQTSRSTLFKTAVAGATGVAAGTALGGALFGGSNSKSGTPDKWNPSSIL